MSRNKPVILYNYLIESIKISGNTDVGDLIYKYHDDRLIDKIFVNNKKYDDFINSFNKELLKPIRGTTRVKITFPKKNLSAKFSDGNKPRILAESTSSFSTFLNQINPDSNQLYSENAINAFIDIIEIIFKQIAINQQNIEEQS